MSKAAVETKVCGGCGEKKPITAYYRMKDGRLPHICKACDLASAKQRMKERNDTLDGRLYSKFNDARKAARKYGTTDTLKLAHVHKAYQTANDNGCIYCGKAVTEADFSLDHIVPFSRGGTNEDANVVICHTGCNAKKNVRPAADYVENPEDLMRYVWPRMEEPLPLAEVQRMLFEGERGDPE